MVSGFEFAVYVQSEWRAPEDEKNITMHFYFPLCCFTPSCQKGNLFPPFFLSKPKTLNAKPSNGHLEHSNACAAVCWPVSGLSTILAPFVISGTQRIDFFPVLLVMTILCNFIKAEHKHFRFRFGKVYTGIWASTRIRLHVHPKFRAQFSFLLVFISTNSEPLRRSPASQTTNVVF